MSDPNLTEEQKRLLLGKAEDLFSTNLSKKFNLKELEQMAKIDENMIKDKVILIINLKIKKIIYFLLLI